MVLRFWKVFGIFRKWVLGFEFVGLFELEFSILIIRVIRLEVFIKLYK